MEAAHRLVTLAALMQIGARPATDSDLTILVDLYRSLEKEMVALHPMWPLADGLPEPVEEAWGQVLASGESHVYLGTVDDVVVGLLLIREEDLLPQAAGERLGSIRLVFVDMDAREVGVGEAMLELALGDLRRMGLRRFDAHVLPGHRLAKNFFEAGGFAARSIIMHHVDG
ncbi:MAG TPA: GNAT family N-acetyltransferase [Acidimicrobiia bacterium]|nr:GNAT family N-acetyltransferase [Acidimicrobiia bacterium]